MTEPNAQNEKPKEERRLDPELVKRGLRCDLDQYEMLKRCSDKRDITEWNEWRETNKEDIYLEGANLENLYLDGTFFDENPVQKRRGKVYLRKAVFRYAKLRNVRFFRAYLENADFHYASLKGAYLVRAHLEGTDFSFSRLKGAKFGFCTVDGSTIFCQCEIDQHTWLYCVGLDNIMIEPATKQLLEYNIRRKKWQEWYWGKKLAENWWLDPPSVRRHRLIRIVPRLVCTLPAHVFFLISDYGLRTWRIIFTFFGLAFGFALVYWLWPSCVMVNGGNGEIRGLWHAIYFSVVTMTTLGFGDIAANPDSWLGQTLLMVQVILGYVLLAALVTRFAVLFTAGGPAGKFADDKGKKDKKRQEAT